MEGKRFQQVGKHQAPRRAQLIPVLAVAGLAFALIGVSRFAVAMNDSDDPQAASPTTSVPSPTSTSEPPRDKGEPRPRRSGSDKESRRETRKNSEELRKKVQKAAKKEEAPPLTFRLSSFNVLGHSHTVPGGTHGGRGFAPGTSRIAAAAGMIRGAGVSVVGLQEYEPPQHNVFVRNTGWGVYPGMQLGTAGVRNSIAWNDAVWSLVEAHTIQIPYFRGNRVPMPYILLEHAETGRRAWFINIHNPASNARRGNNQHWRTVATGMEIALMNQLKASGTPVFLMGDFNERNEAFCRVTVAADALAANGGTGGPPCQMPAGAGIDWIFGTSEDVAFSGYRRVETRTSDHPMIVTDVTLTGPAD